MPHIVRSAVLVLAGVSAGVAQTDRYVVKGNPGAEPPYASWAQAAATIQDAVGVCASGDVVRVRAGVYDTGWVTNCPAGSTLKTRVAITSAYVTVCSEFNDPENTVIRGSFDTGEPGAPGTITNGPNAVRCVFMGANTRLIGFTITNGATLTAGDISGAGIRAESTSPVVSNCMIAGNAAYYAGNGYSAVRYCTLYDCLIAYNTAAFGGGASHSRLVNCRITGNVTRASGGGTTGGTLEQCILSDNWANQGAGGADGGTLSGCLVSGNTAKQGGGGAKNATLTDCVLTNNNGGSSGGGAAGSTLTRCRLFGNKSYVGGGAYQSTLYSCLVAGNEAWGYRMHGGGAADSVLYNCTVVGNLADNITNTETPIPGGGGVSGCLTVNSIVYGNWDDQYGFHNGRVSTNLYSCTTPADPAWLPDAHNTSDEPRFLAAGSGYGQAGFVQGDYRLRVSSRCVNTGTNGIWTLETTDLDGNPRIRQGFVDMGALECMGYDGTSVLLQ